MVALGALELIGLLGVEKQQEQHDMVQVEAVAVDTLRLFLHRVVLVAVVTVRCITAALEQTQQPTLEVVAVEAQKVEHTHKVGQE